MRTGTDSGPRFIEVIRNVPDLGIAMRRRAHPAWRGRSNGMSAENGNKGPATERRYASDGRCSTPESGS